MRVYVCVRKRERGSVRVRKNERYQGHMSVCLIEVGVFMSPDASTVFSAGILMLDLIDAACRMSLPSDRPVYKQLTLEDWSRLYNKHSL